MSSRKPRVSPEEREALALARGAGYRRTRDGEPQRRAGRSDMGFLNLFPLLSLPVIIYNFIGLFAHTPEAALRVKDQLSGALFTVPMVTGGQWAVSGGDLLILFSMVLLFVELLKSTHTGAEAIINHGLSLILFIVCLVQFLLIPGFATSVFFLIMVMTLLDVLAGVIVTIVSARRDLAVSEQGR